MKNKINITLLFSLALFACMVTSCEENYTGKYEITDGTPVIHYVRVPDAAKADSLLVGANLGETICLVGDNLTSIRELYFNDQKALLNINFITKHTLIVTVPRNLPEDRTDKMYMVLKNGNKVDYDFLVLYPAAEIYRFECEHVPAGGKVVLHGDFFFNEPGDPINISVGDYSVPYSDIYVDELTQTKVAFKAPPENITGSARIKTFYGTSKRSKAIFRDTRGMLINFDDVPFVAGWGRPGAAQIQNDPQLSLSGNYLRWEGAVDGSNWNGKYDDGWCLNYWGEQNGFPAGNIFPSAPETSILKFEANVVQPWSGFPLSILFYAQGDNEGKIWDDGYPRGLWRPWYVDGSVVPYTSDGWVTVSIPLKDFNLNTRGEPSNLDFPTAFGGFTFVAKGGGHVGVPCNPVILFDNIRVIPGD